VSPQHFDDCDDHNINVKENVFFSERMLEKALRDTLMQAALSRLSSLTAN